MSIRVNILRVVMIDLEDHPLSTLSSFIIALESLLVCSGIPLLFSQGLAGTNNKSRVELVLGSNSLPLFSSINGYFIYS